MLELPSASQRGDGASEDGDDGCELLLRTEDDDASDEDQPSLGSRSGDGGGPSGVGRLCRRAARLRGMAPAARGGDRDGAVVRTATAPAKRCFTAAGAASQVLDTTCASAAASMVG